MHLATRLAASALALGLALVVTADQSQIKFSQPNARERAFTVAVLAAAQPGDLIFISTGDTWSGLARFLSRHEKLYSHVGVIARGPKGLVVIHAGGNPLQTEAGVHADAVASFMSAVTRVGIYRMPGHLRQRFLAYVENASARRLPFDNVFSLATPDRLYCTELVWRGLVAAMGRDPISDKPMSMGNAYVALDDVSRLPFLTRVPLAGNGQPQIARLR